jgi:hypothetical protein|tara:strand:+ start:91 stop:243 length:153 start_codon:yes stop_codon:yes gene_type:complete
MELNFIFGNVKSQLNDLVNEAKKIDEKNLKKERKKNLNYLENNTDHLKPY